MQWARVTSAMVVKMMEHHRGMCSDVIQLAKVSIRNLFYAGDDQLQPNSVTSIYGFQLTPRKISASSSSLVPSVVPCASKKVRQTNRKQTKSTKDKRALGFVCRAPTSSACSSCVSTWVLTMHSVVACRWTESTTYWTWARRARSRPSSRTVTSCAFQWTTTTATSCCLSSKMHSSSLVSTLWKANGVCSRSDIALVTKFKVYLDALASWVVAMQFSRNAKLVGYDIKPQGYKLIPSYHNKPRKVNTPLALRFSLSRGMNGQIRSRNKVPLWCNRFWFAVAEADS